jgi:hypothetical protein
MSTGSCLPLAVNRLPRSPPLYRLQVNDTRPSASPPSMSPCSTGSSAASTSRRTFPSPDRQRIRTEGGFSPIQPYATSFSHLTIVLPGHRRCASGTPILRNHNSDQSDSSAWGSSPSASSTLDVIIPDRQRIRTEGGITFDGEALATSTKSFYACKYLRKGLVYPIAGHQRCASG